MRALDRGDGVCKHLTSENLCEIYETRPFRCRVDEARPAAIPEPQWHALNKDACKKLHLSVYGSPLPLTPCAEQT